METFYVIAVMALNFVMLIAMVNTLGSVLMPTRRASAHAGLRQEPELMLAPIVELRTGVALSLVDTDRRARMAACPRLRQA